jgi:hypothetical protein
LLGNDFIREAHAYHLGDAVWTKVVGWARDALWDAILDLRRAGDPRAELWRRDWPVS